MHLRIFSIGQTFLLQVTTKVLHFVLHPLPPSITPPFTHTHTCRSQSEYVQSWIRRLGSFAKALLVRMPSPTTIMELMPESFKTCGLGSVVLVGDCTDILTEGCDSVLASSEMHSDKSHHNVAMGLAWVTPNGYVALATDLFCGRTSEQEACKQCGPIFSKIPSKCALMYDKGVAKLQVHLPNLNQVSTLHLYLYLPYTCTLILCICPYTHTCRCP